MGGAQRSQQRGIPGLGVEHLSEPLAVAGQIQRSLVQAMQDGPQITVEVGQPGQAGVGDEARPDELGELGPHVRTQVGQVRRAHAVEAAHDLQMFGEDRLDEADRGHDPGAQVGPDRVLGGSELGGGARDVMDPFGGYRIHSGREDVIEKRRDRAVWIVAEREFLGVGEPPEDVFPRRCGAEQEQPPHPEAVFGLGLGRGGQHPQGDGVPFVDEGREAMDAHP